MAQRETLTEQQVGILRWIFDAAISAWTGAYWRRYGSSRCAVLGAEDPPDQDGRRATIIAPWREQETAN